MNDLIFRQVGKDGYYKIWHTPEKNIFIFIESGEGSIVLRDESYPIVKGALCFIGENKYHYTFPKEPERYVRSKLTVDTARLEGLIGLSGCGAELEKLFNKDSATVTVLSGETYDRAVRIFEQLRGVSDNEKYSEAEKSSAALQLMLLIAENLTSAPTLSASPLQAAIEYINRHISEEITINKVSEASYISKYYLCRLFKEKIGITIMEYVLQTRITAAKELLRDGRVSVTEVATTAGFSSPSYFSRVFKEHTGLSPLSYRKRHGNTL